MLVYISVFSAFSKTATFSIETDVRQSKIARLLLSFGSIKSEHLQELDQIDPPVPDFLLLNSNSDAEI